MLNERLLLSIAGVLVAIPIGYAVILVLSSHIPLVNVPDTISLTPDFRVLAGADPGRVDVYVEGRQDPMVRGLDLHSASDGMIP